MSGMSEKWEVKINTSMVVDDKTAKFCLSMLELYCDSHKCERVYSGKECHDDCIFKQDCGSYYHCNFRQKELDERI